MKCECLFEQCSIMIYTKSQDIKTLKLYKHFLTFYLVSAVFRTCTLESLVLKHNPNTRNTYAQVCNCPVIHNAILTLTENWPSWQKLVVPPPTKKNKQHVLELTSSTARSIFVKLCNSTRTLHGSDAVSEALNVKVTFTSNLHKCFKKNNRQVHTHTHTHKTECKTVSRFQFGVNRRQRCHLYQLCWAIFRTYTHHVARVHSMILPHLREHMRKWMHQDNPNYRNMMSKAAKHLQILTPS